MSLTAVRSAFSHRQSTAARLAVSLVAILTIATVFVVGSWLAVRTGAVPALPAKNPFGTGQAVSSAAGLSSVLFAIQAHFYAVMTAALAAVKTDAAAIGALATVGFLYGIFHAVGPGHGKGIISGYIISNGGSVGLGLTLSSAAALLQAGVAIALVGVLAVVFNATSNSIIVAANAVEIFSFAAVAALGAILVWGKSGELVQTLSGVPAAEKTTVITASGFQGAVYAVIAAGIRPCSGAIILLVYSLSQGLFLAGVCGALAMAVGTAITTGTLAVLTIFARRLMERSVVREASRGAIMFSLIEVMAAAFVMILGLALLTSQWVGFAPRFLD